MPIIFRQGRMPCRKTRPTLTDFPGRTPGKRQAGWPLFWLLFSGHSEKSDSRAEGARKPLPASRRSDACPAMPKTLARFNPKRHAQQRHTSASTFAERNGGKGATDISRALYKNITPLSALPNASARSDWPHPATARTVPPTPPHPRLRAPTPAPAHTTDAAWP